MLHANGNDLFQVQVWKLTIATEREKVLSLLS